MKHLLALFLVAFLVCGCSKQEKPKHAVPSTASTDKVILSTTVSPGSAFKMAVHFDPPQPLMSRKTTFRLTLTDLAGAAVSDATVQASLVMPLMDMGKNQFPLRAIGKGEYEGTGQFTMSGEWEAVFTATVAGKSGKTTFNVRVED
jgi:YtkA-like